jgi:DNA replication ATP-dependent helicase Dna2
LLLLLLLRYDTDIEKDDLFQVLDIGQAHLEASSVPSCQSPVKTQSVFKKLSTTETYLLVNDQQGLLILCPDVLISPTKVADACSCTRRGVLSDRIRSFGSSAPSAVMGKVRHTFIESLTEKVLSIINELESDQYSEAVIVERFPPSEMNKLIEETISLHVEELFCIQMTDSDVKSDLLKVIIPTLNWITIATKQGTLQLLKQHMIVPGMVPNDVFQHSSSYSIESVRIEETIHSPLLGIKGQIDLIAGGKLLPVAPLANLPAFYSSIPIEFKTGRWKASTASQHRAQVILYLLLMTLRKFTLQGLPVGVSFLID